MLDPILVYGCTSHIVLCTHACCMHKAIVLDKFNNGNYLYTSESPSKHCILFLKKGRFLNKDLLVFRENNKHGNFGSQLNFQARNHPTQIILLFSIVFRFSIVFTNFDLFFLLHLWTNFTWAKVALGQNNVDVNLLFINE